MDISWLQDFLMVAETRNFTRAAERRNVSQAAFSRRIQALEAWVGATLIDRSTFPTRLTAAGNRFLPEATEIVTRAMDARTTAVDPAADRVRVRIAAPYALALSNFADWWTDWTNEHRITASLVHGNIHDMGTALAADAVDLLICHHSAEVPVLLDSSLFERHVIAEERLRPWSAPAGIRRDRTPLPGSQRHPAPLLMYTPGVYFARLVDGLIERSPERLHARRIIESDMADVLRELAIAGHGIAWLPDSTARKAGSALVIAGDETWQTHVSIIAFRARGARRPVVERVWEKLTA
jgi:DNA-binding transcriptional LysR family regulator